MSFEQPDYDSLSKKYKLTLEQVNATCVALHAVSEDMLAHIPPSAIPFLSPARQIIAREAKRMKNVVTADPE
jgi:hypothetical protein